MTAERTTVVVLAKPPVAGEVKTRLAPPARAATLARAFLEDTFAALRELAWADPVLATTHALDPALEGELAAPVWMQGDGDLGARIERVLRRALAASPRAIAMGADTPGLPTAALDRAHAALRTADAAIGPTDDGGFYLLALRTCPEGLLAGLPWSRVDTFAATLARLRARGLSTVVLDPWFDVDRPADLERLRGQLAARALHAPATWRALNTISVVMPVLNEERQIGAALADLAAIRPEGSPVRRARAGLHEVIVVDGGSTDRTVEIARAAGARIVTAPRGRGPQLNAGAAAATGDTLLFLHADTTLPHDAEAHVARTLTRPEVVAGAFRTWTIAEPPRPWFAPLLHLADLRSRITRYPYGDQAMFMRASAFHAAGGFPDQPLMEDLELSRRLSTQGRIHTCAASVRVSGRRFVARPFVYTALVNVFPLLYRAGVSPHALARLYRQVR